MNETTACGFEVWSSRARRAMSTELLDRIFEAESSSAPGYAHVGAALLSSAGSVAFAWNQNRGEVVGGPIHWSKAAWLNMTIITFIILPAMWWRKSTAGPGLRSVTKLLFTQFAARGVIELPIIYFTRWWRCGYGISHDAAVFGLMGAKLLANRHSYVPERDRRALAFCSFAMVLLVVEGSFAKLFRQVQDPATGIYFADDSPRFRRVIKITKTVVFIAYPLLALVMWRSRRDFPSSKGR